MLRVSVLSSLGLCFSLFFALSSNAVDFACPKLGHVRCGKSGSKALYQKGNEIQKQLREKNYANVAGETEYGANQRAYQLRRDPKNPNKVKLIFNIVPQLPEGAKAESVLDYKSLLKKCLVEGKRSFPVQGLPDASVEIDYYDKESNHNTDQEAPPELKINIVAHPGQASGKNSLPSSTVWPKHWCGLRFQGTGGKKGEIQKNRDIKTCSKKDFKNCDLLRHELLQSAGLQSEKSPQLSLGEDLASSCHRDRKNMMNPVRDKFTSELSLDQFYFLTTPYCDHGMSNHYRDCSEPYTRTSCVELAAKCKEAVVCSEEVEEKEEEPKKEKKKKNLFINAKNIMRGFQGAVALCGAAKEWCTSLIGLDNTSPASYQPQSYYASPFLVAPAATSTPTSVEAINEKPTLYRAPYQQTPIPRAPSKGSNGR